MPAKIKSRLADARVGEPLDGAADPLTSAPPTPHTPRTRQRQDIAEGEQAADAFGRIEGDDHDTDRWVQIGDLSDPNSYLPPMQDTPGYDDGSSQTDVMHSGDPGRHQHEKRRDGDDRPAVQGSPKGEEASLLQEVRDGIAAAF